jgi:hypothetical protein
MIIRPLFAFFVLLLLVPSSSQALEFATPVELQLQTLRQQRSKQENEYKKSFEALHDIKKQLLREEKELQDWKENHISAQNELLKGLTIVGAPTNVLKIRARQRKLANANLFFEKVREEHLARYREKVSEWESQWNLLLHSQSMNAMRFTTKERALVAQIQAQKSARVMSEWKLRTQKIQNEKTAAHERWKQLQKSRYAATKTKREEALKLALESAKQNNYLQRENKEVAAQVLEDTKREEEQKQAMQLKVLVERLGISGPVNDDLRASLLLHLSSPQPQ